MPNKPGKIDWEKRLAAMKQGQANESSQPAVISPEPLIKELLAFRKVPDRQPVAESELDLKSEPEPDPKPTPKPETEPGSASDEAPELDPTGVSQELPIPLPDPHLGRLDNLERQIRSLKFMGNVALSLAVLLLLSFAVMLNKGSERSGRIIANNFTINDAKGIGRVWLGEHGGQVRVELRDQTGRRRLSLGLDAAGDPRLIFYNKDQQILTEIVPQSDGQSGIKLLNQGGEPVLAVPAPNPPAPVVPEPEAIAPLPTPIPQPEKVPPEAPKVEQESEAQVEAAVK